jgi:hypothetical protein
MCTFTINTVKGGEYLVREIFGLLNLAPPQEEMEFIFKIIVNKYFSTQKAYKQG